MSDEKLLSIFLGIFALSFLGILFFLFYGG